MYLVIAIFFLCAIIIAAVTVPIWGRYTVQVSGEARKIFVLRRTAACYAAMYTSIRPNEIFNIYDRWNVDNCMTLVYYPRGTPCDSVRASGSFMAELDVCRRIMADENGG